MDVSVRRRGSSHVQPGYTVADREASMKVIL